MATQSPAFDALAKFEGYGGVHPFAQAKSGSALDRCGSIMSEARCILSMLSAAFEDSQWLLNKGQDSAFDGRRADIMAGALEGAGTLIDLATFLLEDP